MSDIELKPCPFCGGKAYYYYQRENESIVCEECEAKLTYFDFGDVNEKLVKQWNSRPIEDALQAENERFRKALENIKNEIEMYRDKVYDFHFDIDSKSAAYMLEIANNTLEGKDDE